jgi:hypothetical protein
LLASGSSFDTLSSDPPLITCTARLSAAPRTAHSRPRSGVVPLREWPGTWRRQATGPDEQVAAQLETAATSAFARNAYAAASSAFETAALLSPSDRDRVRRMIGAGRALWLGGEGERAAALLEGVVELADEPTVRADVQELRGLAMLSASPVSETYSMLVAEADRVEPHDAARAAALLANAAVACFMAGDWAAGGAIAQRALTRAGPKAGATATMVLAMVRANLGEVDEALALHESLHESLDTVDPLGEFSFVLSGATMSLVWIEQWVQARKIFDRIVTAARTAAAPTVLTLPLALLSDFELRRGKIAAAYAAAAESVQLAAETGHTLTSFSLVIMGRVEAVLGRDEDCRAHVAAGLETARQTGFDVIENFAASTLGLLGLSRGRADRAVMHLTDCARLEEPYGTGILLPTFSQWAADLVEAQIRSGAVTEAKRSLAILEDKDRSAVGERGRRAMPRHALG